MRADAEGTLQAGFHAYSLGDIETAAAFFSEDAVYALYVDKEILPFGGEVIGRSGVLQIWKQIAAAFELLEHKTTYLSCNDDVVRASVQFAFRHRQSGAVIDGTMRIVAQVTNGQIVRFREYHDQERIRAFMKLFNAPPP